MNDLVPYTSENYPVVADCDMVAEMITEAAGPNGFGLNDLDRVKVPSGGATSWEVPTVSGVEPMKYIDCIILDVRPGRSRWNPADRSSKVPLCASSDGIIGVGDPGGECRNCYYNKFDTAIDEHGVVGRGKACKELRRLTFYTPGEFLPKTLLLPPTSLGRIEGGGLTDISTYNRRLLSGGKPYYRVVTRIGLIKVTEPNPHSIVVFQKLDEIPREQWAQWDVVRTAVINSLRKDVSTFGDETSAGPSHANSF